MTPAETLMPSSEPTSSGQRPLPQQEKVLLVLLLLLGTFLLLYKFPSVPIGLHQDEMSEAYEAYSLLHTGADRWGYHLPVYFLSWGSGQNVLQSYLTIPVVAVLGLTRLSARLIPILCGLLTLPLFFFSLRRWFSDRVALLGLLFLALSPWHIMVSRLGIENSPIPFFILLGVCTFGRALGTRSAWRILPSLLPFALAMYTYGVVVVVIPVLVFLLLLVDPAAIRKARRLWLGALTFFCGASLPLAFFTIKNYVTKTNYGFERWLPFSAPLLKETRLGESMANLNARSIPSHNIHFFLNRFSEQKTVPKTFLPWFQVPGILPVQTILLLLAVFAIVLLLLRAVRERRLREPFLPWLCACSPLIVLVPLNISRGIAIFIPVLALAAVGCAELFEMIPRLSWRIVAAGVFAVLLLDPTFWFIRDYYSKVYAEEITQTFNPQLPEALQSALQLAGASTPIYMTQNVWLNYVQVLFLTSADPHTFQTSGATTKDPDFGPYRFSRQTLNQTAGPFVFLIKADDVAQWNMRHALDERLKNAEPQKGASQPVPFVTDDALQRWNSLLPASAAAAMNSSLRLVQTEPIAAAREKEDDLDKIDIRRLDAMPLCSAPTHVVSVGQFLAGRCP